MIIVETSGVQYANDSIGNSARAITYKMAYVEQYFQFLARGGLTIHCLAEGDDAAEELAFEVAMFLTSLRVIAAEIMQFQEMSMPVQSKPMPAKHENWGACYDCAVSLSYAFAIRRKHTPIDKGLLLNEINSYVHTDGTPCNPTDPADPDYTPLPTGTGETGGTGTGGQNGNYGGTGGINGGDGVDDGLIKLTLKVSKDDITIDN